MQTSGRSPELNVKRREYYVGTQSVAPSLRSESTKRIGRLHLLGRAALGLEERRIRDDDGKYHPTKLPA